MTRRWAGILPGQEWAARFLDVAIPDHARRWPLWWRYWIVCPVDAIRFANVGGYVTHWHAQHTKEKPT